jgi:alkaline phosphatase D
VSNRTSRTREEKITGFATVAGDRPSFWAGLAAPSLPPHSFEPVGVAFVTGSISAPGIVEKMEHGFPAQHPLHALYVLQRSRGSAPEPTVNLLVRHGVRSCLEYERSGNLARAQPDESRALLVERVGAGTSKQGVTGTPRADAEARSTRTG